MTRELLPFDVGLGPVNKDSSVLSVPPTVSHVMADVKMKDAVAEKASESGGELSSSGRNVDEQLQIAINHLC